jgi:hypothetical protein
MIEMLQTPWIADFRPATRGRGIKPMQFGTMRLGHAAASPCGFPVRFDEFPVQAKRFPVSRGTGNRLQTADLLGDWLPKRSDRLGIGRKFQKFPVNFPDLREIGRSLMERGKEDATSCSSERAAIPGLRAEQTSIDWNHL